MKTAGGIQKYHVVTVLTGIGKGSGCDLHGGGLTHFENGNAQLFTADLQLGDSGGAIDVACHQQGILALTLHKTCQLGAVGGLTCALQTYQHNNGRAGGVDGDMLDIAAH